MRPRTHHAVARHPIHLAMILLIQPRLQFGLFGAQIGIANTHLLEAEVASPLFNLFSELLKIERI